MEEEEKKKALLYNVCCVEKKMTLMMSSELFWIGLRASNFNQKAYKLTLLSCIMGNAGCRIFQ